MSKSPNIDFVFTALASPVRREMMDIVRRCPGCNVNELSEHFAISRIGVMKHLGILVKASLVVSRKQGRARLLFFNAVPIQMIYDRWTDEYSAFWVTQAVDLKYKVESTHGAPSKGNATQGGRSRATKSSGKSKRKATKSRARKNQKRVA